MRLCFIGCLLLLALLAACTATSLSVTCGTSADGATVCDLDMSSLNGVWSQQVKLDLDEDAVAATASAALQLDVSVGTGVVRVSFLDAVGERLTYEVTADMPLSIEETAQVTAARVVVTFEAMSGPATGVSAQIRVGNG
ncbi:MAG: hypothetical protein KJ065_13150 [Anaerolineae bacterium]|nr:hypothetical protein [Anaerolineae bacterium]